MVRGWRSFGASLRVAPPAQLLAAQVGAPGRRRAPRRRPAPAAKAALEALDA